MKMLCKGNPPRHKIALEGTVPETVGEIRLYTPKVSVN